MGPAVISLLVFFSYAIVLNTVVPISLYVSVEVTAVNLVSRILLKKIILSYKCGFRVYRTISMVVMGKTRSKICSFFWVGEVIGVNSSLLGQFLA